MKLTFYNHYGVGDLFESREFVLDWMRLAGVKTANYAHRLLPGFFEDLPQLTSVEVRPEMDMNREIIFRDDDAIYVNTWIGRDGSYVTNPGIGCTVEGLYRMHNDMLAAAGLGALPRSVVEYIPDIDYSRVKIYWFLHEWIKESWGNKLVLLCNGQTGSGQAANFLFGPMLDGIAERPDIRYIFTEKSDDVLERWRIRNDITFTDDLTDRHDRPVGAYGPCDFNAISYLSRFCEIIIGRCSGPQMGANVLANWMDSRKKLVCFTHHRNGACFVRDPGALGLKMEVIWSPAQDAIFAGKLLEELLSATDSHG